MQEYSELLRTILEKRDIKSPAEAEVFLNPDYERDLHDPFLMKDMDRACARLLQAIENKEKIAIYADYDCDGIPGAVIIRDLLGLIGHENYEAYIPARNSEGYGLNLDVLKRLVGEGTRLVITVDLGTTAVKEVAWAEENGLDIIITDHHIPHENIPRTCAILNPKVIGFAVGGVDYPEKMLSGAGVAFKFAQGFLKKHGARFGVKDGAEKWMLDMAGLATVADMVPLLGENRAITYFGLKVLRRSPRPGLRNLLAQLRIEQKHLTEDDIGFMLAPRLNAASRMDDPGLAYRLLSTEDETEAGVTAYLLSKMNDDRKTMVVGIMREIHAQFEKSSDRREKEVLVIGNPRWRPGVLGLVAGKLADEYGKPAFVFGRDESGALKGSCRSDGSASVVELMAEARECFADFGGHELAGGFTVHDEKVHFLEETLSLACSKVIRERVARETAYDMKSDLSIVNMVNWREIEKLSPFGLGNPKPVFLFENVEVKSIKKFGKNGSGEHLEIIFSDRGLTDGDSGVKAVSFFSNTDSFQMPLSLGKKVNLLATFDLSRWNGREELRLRIEDIY